ncbi:D-aminoacyl-tRNA deacylase [Spirochaeta thermophila]|uniref:D-aminoacyl-tRNA deacylase n=1 Tax=Winmispira thermophila TaxID=154 RepID=UPI0002E3E8E1|nr:D-aminoacyl-tRNA deacylase [Spirochaeta thermophila]
MRAVVQRVHRGVIEVEGRVVASIETGIAVFLGVAIGDTEEDVAYLATKVAHLRIFEDHEGKMNRSVIEEGRNILVIPQFTLLGDVRKGRRPSYNAAAPPAEAEPLFTRFCETIETFGLRTARGVFGTHMEVSLVVDGPVTILLDSKKAF